MAQGAYNGQFRGTAYYYARFRPGYPQEFFGFVGRTFGLDGTGRLLDLGCGTGQIAIPIAAQFEEVVAMDPEPEMLEELRLAVAEGGARNVVAIEGGSSDLPAVKEKLGTFRLVTMGSSFHWMDRPATLETLAHMVSRGGGIVVAGSSSGGSFWTIGIPWCRVVKATVQKWLGAERLAGSSSFSALVTPERHEAIIDCSPFGPCQSHTIAYKRVWTVDQIAGCLYSTSYCSPALLGDRREAFEADLRDALFALDPSGEYPEDVTVEILYGFLRP